jgi:tetratricopeptide (TPR) repeat protein
MLRALGVPPEHIPPDVQDRARLYRSVLAAYAEQGRPILVVIDNASSSDQARPLLPPADGGRAVITSRHTLADIDARLLDLDILTTQAAVDLLAGQLHLTLRPSDARVAEEPEAARTIARLCGNLPLALHIVAALLAARPKRSLANMAADLDDACNRLDELQYENRSVRAAFDLSYRHLDVEQSKLFRLISLNPGPHISTDSAAVLTLRRGRQVRRVLEALSRAHLIEEGPVEGHWEMHDLVRLYSNECGQAKDFKDGRTGARARLLKYYLVTTRQAVGHIGPHFANMKGPFSDREQALAWLEIEYPNLVAAAVTAVDDDPASALNIALASSLFLDWQHLLDDRLAVSSSGLEAARRIGNARAEGIALNVLGHALVGVNRLDEAISTYQTAIRIFRKLGDLHPETVALMGIGGALTRLGRLDEAIEVEQRSLAVFRKLDEPGNIAAILSNMGATFLRMKRFDEAIVACQEAADICSEIGDLHQQGMAFNNLGGALAEKGNLDEAFTAFQRDLEICRELRDRHGEGLVLLNVADTLVRLKRLDEARDAYKTAAGIFRETGDGHYESRALSSLDAMRNGGEDVTQ